LDSDARPDLKARPTLSLNLELNPNPNMYLQSLLAQFLPGATHQALIVGVVLPMMASTHAIAAEPKPTIVLVHGAFADGSSWSKVILRLEKAGYPTLAVQNPLTGLQEDTAATRRAIDNVKGPVVLVGHSYGGAVITSAGAGNPNVKALVYVAAFAPDAGERIGQLLEKFGPAPLGAALVPDSAGFLSIDRAKFREVFAADVTNDEGIVLAAAQKPVAGAAFGSPTTTPAWKSTPSWYLVSTEDKAIVPELQRYMAGRMGAKSIVEVKSSHVSYITHPDEVVKLIIDAAQ
jgi:pimeloyl-ACP methyl ester carboxylesterase